MRVHGLFECSSKSPFSVDAERVFDHFDRSRILDCDFSLYCKPVSHISGGILEIRYRRFFCAQISKERNEKMATYFLGGTPLSGMERMMRLYPGSQRAKPGYRRFVYSAEDCDCKYCTEYKGKKRGCQTPDCVCFPERLEAGCVTYKELVQRFANEADDPGFTSRVETMLPVCGEVDSLFISADHQKRFFNNVSGRYISHAYATAIFLLASNENLYYRSKKAIHLEMIYFSAVQSDGFTSDDRLTVKAAKDLYEGNLHIALADLIDPKMFSGQLFRLIVNSFIVRRYGLVTLKKVEGKNK